MPDSRVAWALGFGSVFQAFCDRASVFPGHDFLVVLPETAQVYGVAAETFSFARMKAWVLRLQVQYRQAGYGVQTEAAAGQAQQRRVGLLLENRPAFFAHWLALNGLGVSVVPISSEMRVAELAYLVTHSELGLVVALVSHHALLREAAQREGCRLAVIADGDEIPNLALAPSRNAQVVAPITRTECALLYTSGTTGRPKGCMLSNEYFLYAGAWYWDLGGLCTLQEGADRLITPLPMNHMNAMACSTMAMLLSGGCTIVLDRFHPKTWLDSVRACRASIVHYLGVMPSMLMSASPAARDKQHQVRFGFGAGVDKRLHAPFQERFGFPLVEGWAMTETGVGGCIIDNQADRRVGTASFGRLQFGVEARVVDDDEKDVPTGEPGQLLVRNLGDQTVPRAPKRSLGFYSGYLKDAAATQEAWANGWFHTGDIVRQDEQGCFYFIDRKKNVIRRSGENIAAVEVEVVMRRHPFVKDCAAAATPDPVRGDEVLMCVVLKEDVLSVNRRADATLAETMTQHCLQELAYFKAPGYVAFVEALPLTLTQKVQRGELKKLAEALPGQSNCFDTRHLKKRQHA